MRELASERWQRESCPAELGLLLQDENFTQRFAAGERALLQILQQINCQGPTLLSQGLGAEPLSVAIQSFLNARLEQPPVLQNTERGLAAANPFLSAERNLLAVLEKNLARERIIAASGDFLLNEDQLGLLDQLLQDRCAPKATYQIIQRDLSSLALLETNESLIQQVEVRDRLKRLREEVQQVLTRGIRSVF